MAKEKIFFSDLLVKTAQEIVTLCWEKGSGKDVERLVRIKILFLLGFIVESIGEEIKIFKEGGKSA